MTTRQQWITWGLQVGAMLVVALAAYLGIKLPQPPIIVTPPTPVEPPPDVPPKEPTPDPLAAIVKISSGGVGCSATVIGPRRPDGRYWVLTAAHCVERTGQRWTMRFRDGRQVGAVVSNFNRTADWCWMVTDGNNVTLPFAHLAESTPPIGTRVWHAGFGVHIPSNREDGTVTAGVDGNGQVRFRISVSSGDSGGGIVIDDAGRIVSTVCCTTEKGAVAHVWGAAPESFRPGQRDAVDLDEWNPLDIPTRMPPPKE